MFTSAASKLFRGKKHLSDLNEAFVAFSASEPFSANFKFRAQNGRIVERWFEIDFSTPIPTEVPLLLGDAIHCLRCALDHAIWELMAIDGGPQDRWTIFPFGSDEPSFKNRVLLLKTPQQDSTEFLLSLEAYSDGGGKSLYGLHHLDNIDKHSRIMPIALASTVQGLRAIHIPTGEVTPIEHLSSHITFEKHHRFITMLPDYQLDPSQRIELSPKMHFGNVPVFVGGPIIATLASRRRGARSPEGPANDGPEASRRMARLPSRQVVSPRMQRYDVARSSLALPWSEQIAGGIGGKPQMLIRDR